MKDDSWKEFWENYRNIEAQKEEDLYFQVGKTLNQKPISQEFLQEVIGDIQQNLQLNKEDILLEMCCGNGLFTLPLSLLVKKIFAFDFTEHLIKTAKDFKSADNILYTLGNAKGDLAKIFGKMPNFTKVLMNDASAYFTPEEVSKILEQLKQKNSNLKFYITNIPDDGQKYLFYNTPERRKNYEKQVAESNVFLGGMGRWWKFSEFEEIAEEVGLKISRSRYTDERFAYRMNVLFSKD